MAGDGTTTTAQVMVWTPPCCTVAPGGSVAVEHTPSTGVQFLHLCEQCYAVAVCVCVCVCARFVAACLIFSSALHSFLFCVVVASCARLVARQKYAEKLAAVNITLAAREEHILKLHAQLDDQREAHAILRSQNEQLEEQLEDDQTSQLEALTGEFTKRLHDVESKYSAAARDRDSVREQLEELTERFTSEIGESSQLSEDLMKEKDEKIAALMNEGKKLSQENFKKNNVNKKLQAKVKESNDASSKLNARIADAQSQIDKLEKKLSEKTQAEKKYQQSASQVSAVSDQQSKELANASASVTELRENNLVLQTALDKSYKQNSALEQEIAQAKSTAKNAVVIAEAGAQDSLSTEIKKIKAENEKIQEALGIQVADLQNSLRRAEAQGARREDNLQKEISDYNDRLRMAEEREQQLSESMSQTTKPLVRQIDMLRESLNSQNNNHELAEANMTGRMEQAMQDLQDAEDKERVATEKWSEMRMKSSALEEKSNKLRRELIAAKSTIGVLTAKIEELEEEVQREKAANASVETVHSTQRDEWKRSLAQAKKTVRTGCSALHQS